MPKTITQEERQLLKLVEKMPVPEEEKAPWIERIRGGEMSEELAEEIRTKIAGMEEAENDERGQVNRQRILTEFSMLIRRWRFSNQSQHFGKK